MLRLKRLNHVVNKNSILRLLFLTFILIIFCSGCSNEQQSSTKKEVETKGSDGNNIPIKIGLLAPLTGDVATYGQAIKKGVTLALDEYNSKNPTRNIEVVAEDSQANPRIAVGAIQKLIQVDKVVAIIGAVASSVTLSVAPIAEKNHIVLLSPASSSPKITTAGDYIFRNYPSDNLEGKAAAKFAINKSWMKASVLVINNDYGTGLKMVFENQFKAMGGTIASSDLFNEGTNDFRATLLRIKSLKPDVLFIVGYGRELGTIARQGRENGVLAKILSTVNFQDPQTIETGGDAVNGAIYSSPIFDPNSKDAAISDFVKNFNQRFNEIPDVWAAHGYDAFMLIAESCFSTTCNSDSIKEKLYETTNWPGVSGTTTFDRNGDVEKPVRFMTVLDGKFVPFKLD